jgi:RNA ligase (TIGR02306 family)
MIRKLASVRRIKEIRHIKGADRIELAIIDGWQVVCSKDQFKVNDLAIYCEIDSFLPEKPEFEFLRKSCFRTMADSSTGFRLRTMLFQKTMSQGLLLPITILGTIQINEGDNVSELLEIKKFEKPIPACLSGEVKGAIPSVIKFTDQERIQNLLDYFELYQEIEFEETEKCDGSSMSVYHDQGDTGVCGHNWDWKETIGNSYWKVSRELELIERLSRLGMNIALQAEIIGEGIESNLYKLIGQTCKIYDIWDIDHQWYMTSSERLQTLRKLGLDLCHHVPIIGYRKTFKELKTVEQMLEYVTKESVLNPSIIREGIVFKSTERINLQTISFKAISNLKLLNEKD